MTATVPHRPREELFDLYKVRIEEYHFQVNLNWERTRYFLALNVGIVGLATGLLRIGVEGRGQWLVAGLFGFGVIAGILSLAAHTRQHGYYRRSRDSFRVIEDELDLPEEHRLGTTPGMRRERGLRRLMTVTNAINVLLGLLAALNAAGAAYAMFA